MLADAGLIHQRPEARIWIMSAALRVIQHLEAALGGLPDVLATFPFLNDYDELLHEAALLGTASAWRDAMAPAGPEPRLCMSRLREAHDLGKTTMSMFAAVMLTDFDRRFGDVFERVQGVGCRRVMSDLVVGWWADGEQEVGRECLLTLIDAGLVDVEDTSVPMSEWVLRCPPLLFTALTQRHLPAWCPWTWHPADDLRSWDEVVIAADLRARLLATLSLVEAGIIAGVGVTGRPGTGRRTLLGALARRAGRGLLEVPVDGWPSPGRQALLWNVALVLSAMPFVRCTATPIVVSPACPQVFWSADRAAHAVAHAPKPMAQLTVDVLPPALRRVAWSAANGPVPVDIATWLDSTRVGAAHLTDLAREAAVRARLRGVSVVAIHDVIASRDVLTGHVMADSGATAIEVDLAEDLILDPDALLTIEQAIARCRNRERLHGRLPSNYGSRALGVRLLFSGPSGTGKTLASRYLARGIGSCLYRADVSQLVDKYIGETEKKLDRLLDLAEAADCVLLLDEGDALMGRRTEVSSANDRYANLETNFLLQRLEEHRGILIVTTNDRERIDPSFLRRFDVTVRFRLPDAGARQLLWLQHLGDEHAVDERLWRQIARRCELGGGRIRTIAQRAHAAAVIRDDIVRDADLTHALTVEYREMGAVCPLV